MLTAVYKREMLGARSVWGVVVGVVVAASVQAVPARAAVRYAEPVFADIETTRDLVYGEAVNSRGELQQLTLTLYEPAGDTERFRPVFLYAPGGFFTRVDSCPLGYLHDLARRGWVVGCMRYRVRPELPNGLPGVLLPENLPKTTEAAIDAQHDMQAAVRWLRRSAVTYGIDASRIAVAGASAGAITAQGAAYNGTDEPANRSNLGYPQVVTAAVSHAGGWAVGLQGLIEPGSSPVAYFHALDDFVVPFPTAVAPCAATTAVANICDFHPFVTGGHSHLGVEDAKAFAFNEVATAPRTPTSLAITRSAGALLATLTDDDGSPLAGKLVVFTIGSRQVEARTGPDGVATFALEQGTPPAAQVLATFSGEQTGARTQVPGSASGYGPSFAVYAP